MTLAADAPNWADILAAVGQAFGAVATAGAVIVALWLGLRESRWRRAERADRAADQARYVASSCEVHDVSTPGGGAETTYRGTLESQLPVLVEHVVWVSITNGSSAPIFRPTVTGIISPIQQTGPMRYLWDPDRPAWNDRYPGTLNSGETMRVPVACEDQDQNLIGTWLGAEAIVTFVDAADQRWTRTGSSRPVFVRIGERWMTQGPPEVPPRRFRLRLPWTWT